jgi:hypothetical protein
VTAPQTIGIARAVIGLAQGFALYLLYLAFEAKTWLATDGLVFAPLLALAFFVPVLFAGSIGNMRLRTIAISTVIATIVCAGLAGYDILRDPHPPNLTDPRNMSTFPLWVSLGVGLFIAHSLIAAGEAERKFVAGYPAYFDVSWKHGVQLVLAILFTAVFWGLLWLGAELFRLIKLNFLSDLIARRWFWMPLTTLTFLCAIHVTDSRAGLVRGARTLKLMLLSWLLPMMTVIAVVFVLALPFTSLEPLWSTRRATAILLWAVAALVFLINAAYQDGQPETPVAAVLRYSRLLAAIVIVPLAALAAYGLYLRVHQYGWTPQRIVATACVAIAVCYAAGYAVVAAVSLGTLRGIEKVNVATAFAVLAVLLALFSPVADPARISVADQMQRLESGRTAPEQFDFAFLRFDAGRYGADALERLKRKTEGPNAATIAQKATDALAWRDRYQATRQQNVARITPAKRQSNIAVLYPKDQTTVPENFVNQDWNEGNRPWMWPRCLVADVRCEAIMADLDGDGSPEIILLSVPGGPAAAFKLQSGGTWTLLGSIQNAHCAGVREALRAGQMEIVQPTLREIEVGGNRVRLNLDCVPVSRPVNPPPPASPVPPDRG